MLVRGLLLKLILQQIVYAYGILGGYEINITNAPYHVNYGDLCGGVVIHAVWVMTSVHCGTDHNFIRAGSKFRRRSPKIRILYHLVHPNYRVEHTFDFDIQLLRLYRSLSITKRIQVATLSDGNHDSEVLLAGWGYLKEKSDYSDILRQVELKITPIEECQAIDNRWYNHTLTKRMFCAGGDGRDACQGDSGGAAISRGKVIGISSFGFGCGRNIPGVYTNTSDPNIRQWIEGYTGV